MEVIEKQLIGQGNTAEIYYLDEEKILKLFRAGLHEGIVEREYQNDICVEKILDCVPVVYDKVKVGERTGIIYERIIGDNMLQMMLASSLKANECAKKLAHYHQLIQRPTHGELLTVKEKLNEDIDAVTILSKDQKEYIKDYLKQLPDGETLCHFDFHPGNVMIAAKHPFFLDWMTACRGNECADVARTGILLKYGQMEYASAWVKRWIASSMPSIYETYMKEYLAISGKSMKEIAQWELPVMAARLREAISEEERKLLLNLVNQKLSVVA